MMNITSTANPLMPSPLHLLQGTCFQISPARMMKSSQSQPWIIMKRPWKRRHRATWERVYGFIDRLIE